MEAIGVEPFHQEAAGVIYCADVFDLLPRIPDETVQCVVTSPPYWGLRDYGIDGQLGLERTPQEYAAKMVHVFGEIKRILKPDGVLWLNLGDSYASGKGTCYNPGGGVKSYIQEKQRYPLDRGNKSTLARANLKPKDLVGIPWMVAFALRDDGWYLRSDVIWSKPNPMPESVKDRPTKAHEYLFLLTKSGRYCYDAEAIKEPAAESSIVRWNQPNIEGQAGSSRVPGKTNGPMKAVGGPRSHKGSKFHTGKTAHHQLDRSSTRERVRGNKPGRSDGGAACNGDNQEFRNKRSVWVISTKPYKHAHFAVFPLDLVEPCVLSGSRPGDIVLDPFGGSGTVAAVAKKHGRRFISIDLNREYCELHLQRLRQEELF